MAKQNIPPTKSNLQMVQHTYRTAKEGYDLLEQKREILVMELMSYLERTKRLEKNVEKEIGSSYTLLKHSLRVKGSETLRNEVEYVDYDVKIKKKGRKVVGIPLPALEVEIPKLTLQYSQMTASSTTDQLGARFFKLIAILAEAAQINSIVWRLSKEVKKIQRRVNALEKVVMPDNLETARYIQNVLEEKERSDFFVVKMLKDKMEDK